MIQFVKLTSVSFESAYHLRLAFSNGAGGMHDFSAMIEEGGPMVEPLRDADFFARACVDCGALAWQNGFDLDPTQLHREMENAGVFERVRG